MRRFHPIAALAPLLLVSLAVDALAAPKRTGRDALLAIPEVAKDEVICFALYTVHDNVLKLTAQLYPLSEDDPQSARLEIRQGDGWKQVATAEVVNPGWTVPFRVEDWDDTREVAYRVRHGASLDMQTAVIEEKDSSDADARGSRDAVITTLRSCRLRH